MDNHYLRQMLLRSVYCAVPLSYFGYWAILYVLYAFYVY